MRILVVVDHPLVGDALSALLQSRGHLVSGAVDPPSAPLRAREHSLDVVLIDMDGPVQPVLETVRATAAAAPGAAVVLLGRSPDGEILFQALRAGAAGYLTRDLHADSFFELLEGIERGVPPLAPGLTGSLLHALRSGPHQSHPSNGHLTAREVQVLSAMTEGDTSNRALARKLRVSENTVRFHVRNVLQKLHLRSRAGAVAWALGHGLVPNGTRAP